MAEKRPVKKDARKSARRSARVPGAAGEVERSIRDLGDWRGTTLARVRRLIREADPDVVEEMKWKKPSNPEGVPVWSHDGILCTGEAHKAHVRMTFPKGSDLKDPAGLFNSGLEGVRRAIVLREGDALDEAAFKTLIRQAVELNAS